MTSALLALLAAALFATTTVTQHRAATVQSAATGALRGLVANPLWLIGTALGTAGLVAQAAALVNGALVLVQPLLVTGVLFALPAGILVERRRPSPREWGAAAALAAGLALALVAAAPQGGLDRAPAGPLLLGAGVAAAVCLLARGLAEVWTAHRAALLGAAGGLATGLSGVLLKQATGHAGLLAAALSWEAAGFAVTGVAGLALTMQGYAAGALSASLPALAAAEPAVAVALGVFVFHDHLATGPVARVAQVVGSAVVLLAVRALARGESHAALAT